MSRSLLLAVVGWLLPGSPAVPAEEHLFPFVVSYESPANATNVSAWLDRPAGGHGVVREAGGHLATEAGPIRFWATNLCFEACFPTHEQAEHVAQRLARLGINCVRLHHMDSQQIWGKSPNKLTIDPEKLERLDYLIAQLKRQGVYVDINLHVSRSFDKAEGFSGRDQRPKYDKGLDNCEPRMIELQKKYARDLLTHVNPYTQTAYAAEPAVAFVEINNENALFSSWSGAQLDDLPDPYAATFRQLWNAWLRKKYGDTARLRAAWNVGRQELGAEMLTNGDFTQPFGRPWQMETDDAKAVEKSVQPTGPDGRRCLQVRVTRPNKVAWHPQLTQAGLAVTKGATYTLTCWLRAESERTLGVNCMMAHAPWQHIGLTGSLKVQRQWQQHRLTFVADRDEPQARISFSGFGQGTVEMAGVSLRPGGVAGLEPGQQLEDQSVPVLRRHNDSFTVAARRDFIDFLWDTEHDYWTGMYRFLKDDLKVRPLVAGTQLGYSPTHIQAALDYLDGHSYWQHPHFPGRPWDSHNWTVRNVALVNSPGGTLAALAGRRVAGRAYTISEYNHPNPNQYAAEGFPMIAAFAAFQGWDAIYSFAYGHSDRFEPRRIEGYFDIKADTAKLVHMPACVALFVRGDAAPARKLVAVPLDRQAERTLLYETQSARSLSTDHLGLASTLSLLHAVALDLRGTSAGKAPTSASPTAADDAVQRFVADTGQLAWDVSRKGAGYFTADTPRTKLFTGFVAGRTFQLGDVGLAVGPTQLDWATVSLVCIDGPGFGRPGRILIAATGLVHNQDAKLEHLPDDKVTLGARWGSEPVVCEGVPAKITLPVPAARVAFYPLDEAGNRRAAVPVACEGGQAVLALGPQHQTLWYEVEVR